MAQSQPVSVIVAAWNASGTIGRAISSALAQPEVREVILVDDASTDDTEKAAWLSDDGSGRLKAVRQRINRGPAACRNLAIHRSSAPYIAVLDADDYLLPNRFASLFQLGDWDLVADNVAFVQEGRQPPGRLALGDFQPEPARIDLASFVEGNISRFGRPRGELGFVKPVISRDFLERNGLRYDERLRLGEDYALYASALAAGARFIRSKACGYVAVERAGSLSDSHGTRDLEALLEFDFELARRMALTGKEKRAVNRHRRQLAGKVHHRQVLDRRRDGIGAALLAALGRPALAPHLALAVARDKFANGSRSSGEVRYLFS